MYKIAGTIAMILIGFSFKAPGKSTIVSSYAQRPTVETIELETGVVKLLPGDEPVYLIDCPRRNLRLNVLNLPAAYRLQGKTVQFSGNIKATHPLEDEYGELFEITAVH